MPSERVQRQIDRLLDEAEAALSTNDWETVQARSEAVLRLDAENADARTYLEAAGGDGALVGEGPTAVVQPKLPASFVSGRYVVKSFLGEGGRKKVYLAHDERLDRDVAFAVIKGEGLDFGGLERVRREAQAMARLGDHANVVTIYDVGDEEGQPYIVSQYMSGGSLDDLIREAEGHRLAVEQVLRIGGQVCDALEHAHSQGIVHRDIKPGNIWFSQTGTAQLGDFGLALAAEHARMTTEGTMLGTVAYMPPEQALGQPAGPVSDLYSLGCVLYEMVTGRPPFVGDDAVSVISQHLNSVPVAPSWHNPEVGPRLEALIQELLAKAPAQRPESAAAVRQRLASATNASGVVAVPAEVVREAGVGQLAWGRLIGRQEELAVLRGRVDVALGGQGSLTMVVGEPGIGKTRLTQEVAVYAQVRDAQVLWGRCYETEAALPYRPFIEAIRQYVMTRPAEALRSELGNGGSDVARLVSEVRERVPDLPQSPVAEGDADRLRLFESVTTFLLNAAKASPLMIVLDDLHWADAPSLLLLQHLARRLAESRLAVVGTYRDVELDRQHPLSAALGELRQKRLYERVRLHGLTPDEIRALLASVAQQDEATIAVAFSDALYEETEGNPFFIEEIVRHLVETGALYRSGDRWVSDARSIEELGIPEGVREVVGRRLTRLSEACNNSLASAAILGRDFEFEVLGAMTGLDADALLAAIEEALDAQLIVELRDRATPSYQFTHALVQQTLEDELSLPRKQRMHFRAGEAIEKVHTRNLVRYVPTLAVHYRLAGAGGDQEKALKYAIEAQAAAEAIFAWEDALVHWRAAMELLEERGAPPAELAQHIERSTLLAENGVFTLEAALVHLDRAALLFEQAGDELGAARTRILPAVIRGGGYDPALVDTEAAFRDFDAAISALERHGPSATLGLAHVYLANALTVAVRPDDALQAVLRAKAIAYEIDDGGILGWATAYEGFLAYLAHGRLAAGREGIREGWELARRHNSALLGHVTAFFGMWTEMILPHLAEAAGLIDDELSLGRQSTSRAMDLRIWKGWIAAERGDGSPPALNESDLPPAVVFQSHTALASWQALAGEWELADQSLTAQHELVTRMGVPALDLFGVHLAAVKLHRDDLLAAEHLLREASIGAVPAVEARAAGQLAVLYAGTQRWPEAVAELERCHSIIDNGEDWAGVAAQVLLAEALVALGTGDRAEADAIFERALAAYRQYELPWYEAEAQRHWGRALLERGERRAAVEHFDAALEIYRRINAHERWLERIVADRFRAQGVDAGTSVLTSIEAVTSSVQQERPSLARHAAPDGTVTLLFTDIENSTPLNEQLGDRRWMEVLRAHNAVIREHLATHGGYEVKSMGDGFMLAFASARRALQCAMAIQAEFGASEPMQRPEAAAATGIRVRIGLHTGEVVREGDDFFGKHVNLASRIGAAATGGEILVSGLLRDLVSSSGDFVFDEGRDVALKGLTGVQRVYRVTA